MLCDVLNRIPDKPRAVPLPDEVRRYLEHHQIPIDIIEDLAQSSFEDWVTIGPLQVIPMPQLIVHTDGIAICIEQGFLPVAGCPNFDPVVVDRETRRVGYVKHDELASREFTTVRNAFRQSPFRYEDFWEQALVDPSFPIDSYVAQEVW